MSDNFKGHQPGLNSPASGANSITPNNNTDLATVTRAIYVGGAGDLRVKMINGDTVTLTNLAAGVIYPLRCSRVLATSTTATDLVGLY